MRYFLLILYGGLFPMFTLAQVPARFVENKNQWPKEIDFVTRIPGGQMAISSSSFQYLFLDYDQLERDHHQSHIPDGSSEPAELIRAHAVFVDFPGANPATTVSGLGRLDEYRNYYLGNDPTRWASKAYAYTGVMYESFFPKIDLKVYASGQRIKYDYVIAPGGDPSLIRAVYRGADAMSIDNGDLVIKTSLGEIIEKKPIAWQLIEGEKRYIECSYALRGNEVSFAFPDGFDACYELVIDPLLIFSTFSGSTADNWGSTATPGEHGMLYSAGVTNQAEGGLFPATAGAYQENSAGLYDIGILKYDSLGTQLVYATYLGGSGNESPHSLVMNGANELLLFGTTSSGNFPTTESAFERTFKGGPLVPDVIGYSYNGGADLVISRFKNDGTALLASTYVGGTGNDGFNPPGGELTRNYGDQLRGDIITDADNNVYVATVTSSEDFPVSSSFGMTYGGGVTDAVTFKMDKDLSTIIWGAYLGGEQYDAALSVKLDAERNVFIAGGTSSEDFPATPDSYGPVFSGDVDGWIAKIAADGSSILHATFTGTENYNQIYFIDLNEKEEVYVYGQTVGDFPITPGVYFNANSGQFIQKFSNDLNSLIFSTVFGAGRGIPDISPTAFLVNDCNYLYVAGWGGRINEETGYWKSGTNGMTTTPDAYQLVTQGSDFYLLVLTDDAKERVYATFLGGNLSSTHVDGGTSRFDKGGIVYHSVCAGCRFFNDAEGPTSDFPTTTGAWSRINRSPNCNNAAFKFDLSTLKARIRTNSAVRDMPGTTVFCLPDPAGFENRSTGGETYYWDFGDGSTLITTDTAFITHQYATPGKYTVTLWAVDQGTCQVIDQTSVVVTINQGQAVVQDDDDMCFGDKYELQASGGVQYEWLSLDGTFASTEPTPVVSPADTIQYRITIREASGCVRRDTVQINVVPKINPKFEWTRLAECTSRPMISVRNLTDSLNSSDSWFFDFGDGSTSELSEDTHGYSSDGVFNVRVVTQREFCVYEKTIPIPVFELFIPNVITPGKPEHNDAFSIRLGKDDGITPATFGYRVSLSIYNRWGERVFTADDYQYDWMGEGLSAGTYFFEVDIEGHTTCRGWVQLIK
jgi:hypothetical protein